MKKIFLICILGAIGTILIINPKIFVSSNISEKSSPLAFQTTKDSIVMPIKSVGRMYTSLIAYAFSSYEEQGAALILALKNNFKEPAAAPLPADDRTTIINGPTAESQ